MTEFVWTEEQRVSVLALMEKWSPRLFLEGHHINVHFGTEPCSRYPDMCCAEMLSNLPYLSGHTVTLHPMYLEIGDDAARERRIVHELVHIVTGETRKALRSIVVDEHFVTWREAQAVDERVTDWVANIIVAAFE